MYANWLKKLFQNCIDALLIPNQWISIKFKLIRLNLLIILTLFSIFRISDPKFSVIKLSIDSKTFIILNDSLLSITSLFFILIY